MAHTVSALIFDSHAFVKRLTQVGMPLEQAEVLAEEQSRLVDNRLATKEDLRHLEDRIHARLDQAMLGINARLDQMMLRMTVRLGGMVATATGVMIVAIKLL